MHVSPEDVIRCLKTFSAGSSGGSDGLTAQHLRDILSGAPDEKLKVALTDFINILLNGERPLSVKETLFGGRLIALQKKDGGIRPLAVGYTLRRLAVKCANSYVIKRRSAELQPIQVNVEVSGGCEAAVHAIRRLVEQMPDDHVLVKLDSSNAFNTVWRDTILNFTANKTPELYRFVHASLACNPTQTYGTEIIKS